MERVMLTKEGLPVVEMETENKVFEDAIHSYRCRDRLKKSGGIEYARNFVNEWSSIVEIDQPAIFQFMALYYQKAKQELDEYQVNLLIGGMLGVYEMLRKQAEKDLVIDLSKFYEPQKAGAYEKCFFDPYK